jgi:membrane protein DedA with SNARE-associated domain
LTIAWGEKMNTDSFIVLSILAVLVAIVSVALVKFTIIEVPDIVPMNKTKQLILFVFILVMAGIALWSNGQ